MKSEYYLRRVNSRKWMVCSRVMGIVFSTHKGRKRAAHALSLFRQRERKVHHGTEQLA